MTVAVVVLAAWAVFSSLVMFGLCVVVGSLSRRVRDLEQNRGTFL